MVQNAHFGLKYELKHFTTPYMQLPPPAVFHDKAKRTQQGNLLHHHHLHRHIECNLIPAQDTRKRRPASKTQKVCTNVSNQNKNLFENTISKVFKDPTDACSHLFV